MLVSSLARLLLSKVLFNSTLIFNELLTQQIATMSLNLCKADWLGKKKEVKEMERFRKVRAEKCPIPISGTYKLQDNQTLDIHSLYANQGGKYGT